MENRTTLHIEVVYAGSERQCLVTLDAPAGITAAESVRRSGLAKKFPEVDLANCRLGIWGRVVTPGQSLRDGDRVEIYRPLRSDPKAARRERARAGVHRSR
ncbi:MAG TPA: RnfH family protein [Bryobacteraceae bacterium]